MISWIALSHELFTSNETFKSGPNKICGRQPSLENLKGYGLPKTILILSYAARIYLAGAYLLKVNNGNSRVKCEICSKFTIKTSDRRHWRHSGVLIVNLQQFHTFF